MFYQYNCQAFLEKGEMISLRVVGRFIDIVDSQKWNKFTLFITNYDPAWFHTILETFLFTESFRQVYSDLEVPMEYIPLC